MFMVVAVAFVTVLVRLVVVIVVVVRMIVMIMRVVVGMIVAGMMFVAVRHDNFSGLGAVLPVVRDHPDAGGAGRNRQGHLIVRRGTGA